jgi:hypothetical protein
MHTRPTNPNIRLRHEQFQCSTFPQGGGSFGILKSLRSFHDLDGLKAIYTFVFWGYFVVNPPYKKVQVPFQLWQVPAFRSVRPRFPDIACFFSQFFSLLRGCVCVCCAVLCRRRAHCPPPRTPGHPRNLG